MIAELDKKGAEELLSRQSVARLGCVLASGEPYVVPVNYLFRDGSIFIHSLPGLKIEALRANPKACLQVDWVESVLKWRSVIVFGEFEEILDEREREELLREFTVRFHELTPVESVKERAAEKPGIVLFRIRVRRLTGLRES